MDGTVRPKLVKPSNQASNENPKLRESLRRSVHIASKNLETEQRHEKNMPVGTATGHGNPCDNTLDEFNLTEKTKDFLFGDINSIYARSAPNDCRRSRLLVILTKAKQCSS
jgi:hypothetical protein